MYNDSDSSDFASPQVRLGVGNPRHAHIRSSNTFGILHQIECRLCRDYASHSSAFDSDHDAPFHIVEEEREKSDYLLGFRAGRAAQQKHDSVRVKEYRQQCEEARNIKIVYEVELKEAKEEISQLRSELLALRLSLGASSWDSTYSDNSHFSNPEYESSSDEAESDSVEEFEKEWEYNQTWDSGSPPYVFVEPLNQPQAVHDSLVIHQQLLAESSLIFGEETQLPELPKPTHIPPSIPTATATSDDAFYTIEKIKKMMFLAHKPDRQDMLTKVKAIVSKAHGTPAFQRTLVQDYLMREWRRPGLPLFEEESKTPLELFVDASNIGIGLTVGQKWRSWALKKGWKTREREIQWAEAVAVELGLRSMVEAGHVGRHILVRSDNTGVVNALQNRTYHCPQTGEIVKKIFTFCDEWGIQLQIKWVPGEENPADAPSRMRFGNVVQRFAHIPQIPVHLQEFVHEINC